MEWGWASGAGQVLTHGLAWHYKGTSPGASCCLLTERARMAQGAVIHVAPEQPTHAVCVVGTATPLDVRG